MKKGDSGELTGCGRTRREKKTDATMFQMEREDVKLSQRRTKSPA